jgi:hypothetical protein
MTIIDKKRINKCKIMRMSKRVKGRIWWETAYERAKEEYKNRTKEGKIENEEESVRGIKERKREKRKRTKTYIASIFS